MTWFKLDDQFHSNLKVIVAGNAAVGLYCRLGTYCADKLTDGFIPTAVARSMGTAKEIKALRAVPMPDVRPLLEAVPHGYLMRDYLDHNPSREVVLEERAKAKDRMDKLRGRSPVRSPEQTPNEQASFGRSSPSPVPVPLRANGCTESSVSQTCPVPTDDDEFDRIIEMIVDRKAERHPPKSNPKGWRQVTRANTIAEDGQWVKDLLEHHVPPHQIASTVINTRPERMADEHTHPDDCEVCDGGFVMELDAAGVERYRPCSERIVAP